MSAGTHVMTRAGVASMALVALALMLVVPGRAFAQDQQPGERQRGGQEGPGGGRDGPGGGRGNFDPEQFRQRIAERMKEALGANDDEFAVIQPKIEKVMDLQRQSAGGGGMGMIFGGGRGGPGGGGGGRGGRGPGGGDDSPVSVARRDLQKSVEANAGPDELKAKMAALRDARAKGREELTKAQQELRELLTMKQEAALVMMGMLE